MNITDMKKDEKATIISMQSIHRRFYLRLMDLGIYEKAEVTLLKKLSFDRLYLLEVDDIEICLRKEDALKIEVRK